MDKGFHAHHADVARQKGYDFSDYVRSLLAAEEAKQAEAAQVATELRGIRIAIEKMAEQGSLTGSDAVESAKGKLAATLGAGASKHQKQA